MTRRGPPHACTGSTSRVAGLRLECQVRYSEIPKANAGHREESVDEGSWVVVLSVQLPRCEGRRSPGVLGWTAVLVAAFLCASAFVATARAEDPPPPVSDGAASSSDSTATDGPSATSADSSAAAIDTSAATDTSATTSDTSDTSGATTDTSGAAPSDAAGGSDAQAPDSLDEAASASTDPGASTAKAAPADAGAPTEAGAPTSAANGSTDPVAPASSPAPADRDEATIVPLVPTFGLAPETDAVGVIRWAVDCRVIAVCDLVPLARAPSDSERVLFGQCPPHEATQAGQPGARPGGGSGRPHGAQRPESPRPPAPDHQPQGPPAPGALLGFSSSGGFHSGVVLGLIAALLGLTLLEGRHLVTPFERRLPALLLGFSLERPG